MSTFIELEIQNLLNAQEDLEQVADKVIATVESNPDNLSSDNITSLSRFLLRTGFYRKLVDFVLRHLDNESFQTPWAYFLEALAHSTEPLDDKVVKALLEGIAEQNAEAESSRSDAFKNRAPELQEWRTNRKYKIQREYVDNKKNLLEQLITLRTQQLYEQEKSMLQRLLKLYPGDREIHNEIHEHKQRYALEILSRKSPKAKVLSEDELSPHDPELEEAIAGLMQSLAEHAEEMPEMAYDFAIVAYMLDQYADSLHILNFSNNESESVLWFRLEVLLKARHFVEVLHEITHLEVEFAHDPETFFATAYLRAQAYWGLGQKHSAMEVMDSVLISRPHYRAASALLSLWSQQ